MESIFLSRYNRPMILSFHVSFCVVQVCLIIEVDKLSPLLAVCILLNSVQHVLSDVSAQTFAETCQKNGRIGKDVEEAETCDVGFKTPCPQTNLVMKNGVCTVRIPYRTVITCSCCCVNYQ
ncbi:hypothetical protein MKX01_037419 [Papaver californicum]|nr:hypothetical protein MKX01_037419 [Papaver californicum]